MDFNNLPSDLQETVRFHGHLCPGLTIGYRAAKGALEILGLGRWEGGGLVAVVENHSCGIDAVQVICGCTAATGNLIILDYGKPVYTIGSRQTGKAVRIALREDMVRPTGPDGRTDREKYIEMSLNDPLESLCRISEPEIELPAETQNFATLA